MKELSIEEKAKRYDEAIDVCRKLYNKAKADGYTSDIEDYEQIFPELKESEDGRIRKVLIELSKEVAQEQFFTNRGTNLQNVITWLEKQGEQKPVEWSEEDESWFKELELMALSFSNDDSYRKKFFDWFKSLKDRVQPQHKQEWSEEDYNEIEIIACHLDNIGNEAMAESLLNIMDKYKSCRPQSQWKPSDEQMIELRRVISGCSYDIEPLAEMVGRN